MTDAELEAIVFREQAATALGWEQHQPGSLRICDGRHDSDDGCSTVAEAEIIGWTRHGAEVVASFLDQAPSDIRALVAEVRRLRELVVRAATEAYVAGYGGETVTGCVYCQEASLDDHAPTCPVRTL